MTGTSRVKGLGTSQVAEEATIRLWLSHAIRVHRARVLDVRIPRYKQQDNPYSRMHSSLVRVQNVFGFFTTVAFCVAALVALSAALFPANPTAIVDVRRFRVVKGRAHQYYASKVQEYAFINFDLEADLGSLFNWNTKQVFAYISASYPGSEFSENEAVIWDAILPHRSASKFRLNNERAKYNINDITGKFADRENITLSLYWNVQPHIGVLTWGSVGISKAFTLPPLEGKGKTSIKG